MQQDGTAGCALPAACGSADCGWATTRLATASAWALRWWNGTSGIPSSVRTLALPSSFSGKRTRNRRRF